MLGAHCRPAGRAAGDQGACPCVRAKDDQPHQPHQKQLLARSPLAPSRLTQPTAMAAHLPGLGLPARAAPGTRLVARASCSRCVPLPSRGASVACCSSGRAEQSAEVSHGHMLSCEAKMQEQACSPPLIWRLSLQPWPLSLQPWPLPWPLSRRGPAARVTRQAGSTARITPTTAAAARSRPGVQQPAARAARARGCQHLAAGGGRIPCDEIVTKNNLRSL